MTNFGDIVEPSTRSAWEDWDEDIQNENSVQLKFQQELHRPGKIETLLILEGRYLTDYIKTQHNLEQINSISEVNLKLYKTSKENNYVCVIMNYDLVVSSEIVELLKPYITVSNNVVAILTKPIVEYQVSKLITQDYIIRALYTSKPISTSLGVTFAKLEQPNIISGVSAGVISLREALGVPAAAIICYHDYSDEQNIQELNNLLKQFKVISNIDKERSNMLKSNLYI